MTRETIVFGDPQTEKVDFFAAAQEFEVEMRTGRMSGLSHITNYTRCIHCPSRPSRCACRRQSKKNEHSATCPRRNVRCPRRYRSLDASRRTPRVLCLSRLPESLPQLRSRWPCAVAQGGRLDSAGSNYTAKRF